VKLLGVGDAAILPADPLTQSAADLLAWLSANACSQNAITQVSTFQTAWNTAALGPTLTVDGKYGPLTRGALQSVMNAEGTGTAPPDCFSAAAVTPAAAPPPANAATVTIPPLTPPPTNWGHVFLGAAIVAGVTVVGYTFWQKHVEGTT
jgi:hypothetical protein